jgi:hypothetical protein
MNPSMGTARSRSIAAALLSSLPLLAACSSKHEGQPAPIASAESPPPTAAPSASAPVAPAELRGPTFKLARSFDTGTALFGVKHAIIACEDHCRLPSTATGKPPKTSIVTADKVQDDPTLWPEHYYYGDVRTLVNQLGGGSVHYHGDYPKNFYSILDHPYDRGGIGQLQAVKRSGKGWVPAGDLPREFEFVAHSLPRELDEALLHSPWPGAQQSIVAGGDGPVMQVSEAKIATWSGKSWSIAAAPWHGKSGSPVRLASGATLVPTDDGAYWLPKEGPAERVRFEGAEAADAGSHTADLHILSIDDAPWFERMGSDATALFIPQDPAAVRIAEPLKRVIPPKAPPPPSATAEASAAPSASAAAAPSASAAALVSAAPLASAAPSASASAAPSASALASAAPSAPVIASASASAAPAVDPNELSPAGFYAKCPAPFVILATPPSWGTDYEITRQALTGHGELQDDLAFVEFQRQKQIYFGAQAKSEEVARKVMELVSERGIKPQLACLDALAKVPDRYEPPRKIRIWFFNLQTGENLYLR